MPLSLHSGPNRSTGRLLMSVCATACIGIALVTLLIARHHPPPADAQGSTARTTEPEHSMPADEPSDPKPHPKSSAKVKVSAVEMPIPDDPIVPTHRPDPHNPLDTLAEDSILRHGDRQSRMVALTFDDGPNPARMADQLAILDRYGVKATFFVVGQIAEKYPDTVKGIYDAGHLIANHTWDHRRLGSLPGAQVEAEWEKCGDTLYSIIRRRPTYCRPPGCNMNANVVLSAAHMGMTTVLYTINPADYTRPGKDVILSRILRKVQGGDIILLHDGVEQTIEILPKLIETLQARGYELVTIEEMDRALWMPPTPASSTQHPTPDTQPFDTSARPGI